MIIIILLIFPAWCRFLEFSRLFFFWDLEFDNGFEHFPTESVVHFDPNDYNVHNEEVLHDLLAQFTHSHEKQTDAESWVNKRRE